MWSTRFSANPLTLRRAWWSKTCFFFLPLLFDGLFERSTEHKAALHVPAVRTDMQFLWQTQGKLTLWWQLTRSTVLKVKGNFAARWHNYMPWLMVHWGRGCVGCVLRYRNCKYAWRTKANRLDEKNRKTKTWLAQLDCMWRSSVRSLSLFLCERSPALFSKHFFSLLDLMTSNWFRPSVPFPVQPRGRHHSDFCSLFNLVSYFSWGWQHVALIQDIFLSFFLNFKNFGCIQS